MSGPNLCPCSNQSLCNPIPKQDRVEFFTWLINYNTTEWIEQHVDWNVVTGIILYFNQPTFNPQIICLAHSHNVRVFHFVSRLITDPLFHGGLGDPFDVADQDYYMTSQINVMLNNFGDGINLDMEGALPDEHYDNYVDWIYRWHVEMSQYGDRGTLSMDLPLIPPKYIYSIRYLVDYYIPMAYDYTSYDVLSANSPMPITRRNLMLYYTIVDPKKMILGVPWYGYYGQCKEDTLFTKSCTVAPGESPKQIPYTKLYYQVLKNISIETSDIFYGPDHTPVINTKDAGNGIITQYQFDNSVSIHNKVSNIKLGGAASWALDFLDGLPSTDIKSIWMGSKPI